MSERNDRKDNYGGQNEDYHPDKFYESLVRKTHATLHTRRDPAGYRAFETLDKAGEHFRIKLDLPPEKEPYVAWGEEDPDPEIDNEGRQGEIFEGQAGIEFFIHLMGSITLRGIKGGNPAHRAWHQRIREDQREINRSVMYPEGK